MRKKLIIILMLFAIAVVLTSCDSKHEESPTHEPAEEAFTGLELNKAAEFANRYTPYNLENLEETCDAIVIGTYVGDTEQKEVYMYDEYVKKDTLVNTITYGSIEVSKVFKGDFQEGDTIKYAQEYGVLDGEYLTFSCLTPISDGDTWLFFLFDNYDGTYRCLGDSDGRYPVKNFSYQRIALTDNEDLGVFDEKDFNKRIYNEILEKYEF